MDLSSHPWTSTSLGQQETIRLLVAVKGPLACVVWRFCRAGRRSGVAAKFAREAREARENERRSREKNFFQIASAPISSRFLCPRPPLLLSAPNQNRHATQAKGP